MPEEQSAPISPAPASPSPAPAGSSPVKGKSNTLTIVIVVLLIIVVLGGLGTYFVYRYLKNKVTTAITDVSNTTINGTTVTGSPTDDYNAAKDLTPSDAFSKAVNTDVKAALKEVYGDVKLSIISSDSADYSYLNYILKKNTTATDGDKISAALIKLGYTKDNNTASGDGFMVTLSKGTTSLSLTGSNSNMIIMIASKSAIE